MALWKPFRGTSAALADVPKTDGHAYFCTDDGSLFFDYKDENNELHRKQITAQEEYEHLVTLTTAHAVDSAYRIANVTNSNFLSTPFTAGDCLKVNLKVNDQVYEGWVVGADDSTGVITSKNPMGSYGDSGFSVLADGTAGYFGYVLPSAVAGEASLSDLVPVCITLNAEVSCDPGGGPVMTPKTGSIAIFSMFGNSAADSDPIQLKIYASRSTVIADPMTLAGQAFVFNYNDDANISMVTPEKTSLVNFGDGSVEYYPSENTILTHSYAPSEFGVKPNALHIYGDIKHLPNNFLKGAVCLTSFELTKARTFGESAFENCVNLVCAVMHPETTTISRNAFKGCTSLKDIDLRGVTTIAESAFENCSALTSITLPDSLRQIEANAFKGTGLTTVIIPAGVTTIADTAFDSTTKLIAASELANMQVASSSSKFDSLVSSENIGKAVSYNKNLYIIDKGAKEIEVGDNLTTLYFDTSIEPNLAALSYDEDGLSLALWGIDSNANREYPIIGAVRWDDFAQNGATGYGLIGYASNSSDVTVIYSTTAFTIPVLNFTVHKGWSITQLNLIGTVPVTNYEAGAKSVLGYVLSSAAISSDNPVAIGMLTHEEDPTVPAWAKAAEKPEYTYDEIKGKPSLATVATTGSYNDLTNKPTIPAAVTVDSALSTTSTNPVQNKVINTALAGKVDKVSGKGLSTNDLTAALKSNYDAAYTHSQATHARTDATKVEASSTNGKIKINGTETTVYTHPTGTNPHGTTKSDVGLGNVGNFKAVSTVASQGLTDTEKSNARANIGAGTSSLTIGTASTQAAAGNHTHKYAGSSSAGGSATSAVKLDTATAGSATQPVYFTGGKPTACTYTLAKSVPADAIFTDNNTTYTFATGDANGQIKVTPSGGSAQNVAVKGLGSAAYTATTNYAAASSYPNNSGDIKTKCRIAKRDYTGGDTTTWYYKLCTLPANNSSNYASALVSGRIGGWESANMSYINALLWNRGTPGIALIDISADGTSSTVWNKSQLVMYVDGTSTTANATATVYIACKGYFTFDIDLKLYQDSCSIVYDGTPIKTTPTGTLAAQCINTNKRLELANGTLQLNGKTVLTEATYNSTTKTLTIS